MNRNMSIERQNSQDELIQLRRELSHSNEILQLTQQLGRIGTWVYELESGQITWSDEVYRLYRRDPLLGPPSVEEEAAYYSKEQGKQLRSTLDTVLRTGQSLEYDIEVLLPGGEKEFFASAMYPVKGPDGSISRLIGTVQDIGERMTMERKLKESETQYRTLFEEDLTGDFVATIDGTIRFCNRAFLTMFGFVEIENCNRTNIADLFHYKPDALAFLKKIRKEKNLILHEQRMVKVTGEEVFTIGNYSGITNDHGVLVEVKGYVFDTTSRKRSEQRKALIADILKTLNRPNEWKKLIHDIMTKIQDFTGYQAIGIRLKEADDYPYYEKIGFPDLFSEARNSLCQYSSSGEKELNSKGMPILECMCGRVLSGEIDAGKPQFTQGGSFWTNSVSALMDQPGNEQEVLFPRGNCIRDGYQSIALIPIQSGEEVIGLLQLNDPRKDAFSMELIHFFEEVANTIGLAFHRILQEKRIRENEQQFRLLFQNDPFPRWVYDLETLAFLDVNEAAVTHYGFSREEFLTMTLKDIRPAEEIPTLLDNISRNKEEFQSSSNWHHRKKDGSVIEVEITSHATTYNGRNARVVLAKDVTEQRRQERELRDTKTYLEKLLDNANAPIISLNSDLSVRGVNREFRDMTGFTTEEFCALGFQILFTEDQLEGIRDLTEEVKQGVQWKNLEIPVRTKSGVIREVSWNTANIFADDGTTLISVLAIGNDITERKKAEWDLRQSEQLLGEVVEILPVGIWITDASGQINIVNPAGRQIWAGARYVGPEQYGEYKGWWRSTGEPISASDWAAARAVQHGETSIDEEIEIECFDGTRKIILNSAIPIKNEEGDITGAVIVNQDITERIESENQIRRINRVLEEAKVKAEESDRLKTSLLNNLSHEFRTPMNAILGFSSMIESDSAEPEFRGMAHRINIAGGRLMKTLDDILELAQLESYTPDEIIQPVNVVRLIQELMPGFREKAVSKGLELSFVPMCMAEARIRQDHLVKAIHHLVDNAIKFTDQGRIEIKVQQVSERRHKWVEIRIEDSGVGIPKEHQQVIFEAFRQASEGYGRTYEGTGLGLTIANKIVTNYDGQIALNSNPGEGSTFTISFPREVNFPSFEPEEGSGEQDEAPAVQTSFGFSEPPKEILILVVEDNQDNVDLLVTQLGGRYKIFVAYDGKTALSLAGQMQFVLILMDINLGPDMDGLEVTRIIRKKPGYDHIPIIAVTGYTNASDKNLIFQAGCSHYLGKPFTKEQLLGKIKEAIQ